VKTDYTPANPDFRQRVQYSFERQQAMATLGASIIAIEPGAVAIRMPFSEAFTQQHGFIHAGIISTVLDSACGYAAFTLMPKNAAVLTIEYKINLLSPAKGDWFEAVGIVKKPGRNVTVADGEVYAHGNGDKKLVASMVGTLMSIYDRDGIEH
jgi:uncharacterized protein (TIGR00369 family)